MPTMTRSRSAVRFVFLTLVVFGFSLLLVSGQQPSPTASARPYVWTDEPDGCTSIQVGRLASEDGSVMTAHTCDGNYRNWLNIVPHAKYPAGSKNKIFSGKMHTERSRPTSGA